jgi:hypothetical protein
MFTLAVIYCLQGKRCWQSLGGEGGRSRYDCHHTDNRVDSDSCSQFCQIWLDPRAGLDDVEKRKFLTLSGLELRSLGRPARSQSIYRLSYRGFHLICNLAETWRVVLETRTWRIWPSIITNLFNSFNRKNVCRCVNKIFLEYSSRMTLDDKWGISLSLQFLHATNNA